MNKVKITLLSPSYLVIGLSQYAVKLNPQTNILTVHNIVWNMLSVMTMSDVNAVLTSELKALNAPSTP